MNTELLTLFLNICLKCTDASNGDLVLEFLRFIFVNEIFFDLELTVSFMELIGGRRERLPLDLDLELL